MAYVGLDRGIVDHWIYQDAEYFKTWFEMLHTARYSKEPFTDLIEGELVTVNYTEFIFGRIGWSKRLKIGEQRLRTLIKKLTNEQMIEVVQHYRKCTVYRIINYEKYNHQTNQQSDQSQQENLDDTNQQTNQRLTSTQPAANQQLTTKEESNKEKEGSNKEILSEEELDESEIMNRSVQIEKHYCKKRKTLDASSNDFQEIKRVVASKIPVEFIIACLDRTFAEYKPKHENDQIRTFSYCATAIFDAWDKHTKRSNPVEGNVKHFSKGSERSKSNGWSGKRQIPIITETKSTPLTAEQIAEIKRKAQRLDGREDAG